MFRRCNIAPFRYVLGWLLLSVPVFAQFNSNVQGTVTDASGAEVPKATVTLHNQQTGVDNKTQTDNHGFYRFSDVLTGSYYVAVDANGFQRQQVTFRLGTGETAGINVSLQVAGTSTNVTVTEQAPRH